MFVFQDSSVLEVNRDINYIAAILDLDAASLTSLNEFQVIELICEGTEFIKVFFGGDRLKLFTLLSYANSSFPIPEYLVPAAKVIQMLCQYSTFNKVFLNLTNNLNKQRGDIEPKFDVDHAEGIYRASITDTLSQQIYHRFNINVLLELEEIRSKPEEYHYGLVCDLIQRLVVNITSRSSMQEILQITDSHREEAVSNYALLMGVIYFYPPLLSTYENIVQEFKDDDGTGRILMPA